MSREREIVEFIIKALVDNPDSVSVRLVEAENTNILEIKAERSDYGKIIGRKGRIVNAIRTLLAIVSRGSGKKWLLDVPNKDEEEASEA